MLLQTNSPESDHFGVKYKEQTKTECIESSWHLFFVECFKLKFFLSSSIFQCKGKGHRRDSVHALHEDFADGFNCVSFRHSPGSIIASVHTL